MTYIIPNLLFANDSLKLVRKFFLEKNKILHLINLGDGIFQHAVVPTMIFSVQNSNVETNYTFKLFPKANSLTDLEDNYFTLKREDVLKNFNYVFETASPLVKSLLNKIAENSVLLQDILEVNQGIITGNDEKYLSQTAISSEYKQTVRGRDIDKYITHYPNLFVKYNTNELACPRTVDLFDVKEKLLMRRTGDKPILSLDDKGSFNLHTLYSCRNKSDYNLKFILGLCNSKLFEFIYQQRLGTEIGRTFAEIKILYIRQLPVKTEIPAQIQTKVVTLVETIINQKVLNPDWDSTIAEQKIDELVYQAYSLTAEEISLVEHGKLV